jgi:hypothetical protein
MNRTRRNKEISRTAALGHGRSARSESESRRFGKRSCGIEAMLDPLEVRRDKQLRRRRPECARRQKNRRTDRAIVVIVGRNLRRRSRIFISESDGVSDRGGRALRHPVQMHMAERQHDLQHQRRKCQQRSVLSMAMNPGHPHLTTLPRIHASVAVTFGKRRVCGVFMAGSRIE